MWFCKSGWDCPDHGASGVTCNSGVGVCNIAPVQAASAKSSSAEAAAADVAQTAAAEAAGPKQAAADAGGGTIVTDAPGRGSTAAAAAPATGQSSPHPAAAAAPMAAAVAAAAATPGPKLPTLNVTTDRYRPGLRMEIVQVRGAAAGGQQALGGLPLARTMLPHACRPPECVPQDECEDDDDCPRPDSRCMQNYQTSQFSCVRWK